MQLINFSSQKHITFVTEWRKHRDMHEIKEVLPEHGLIAFEGGHAIAVGFLRGVEGGYAMLDGYVTNPKISPELRDRALDRLTTKLIKIAKYAKVKKLLAFTLDNHTLSRALRHNFVQLPLVLIGQDLSEEQL